MEYVELQIPKEIANQTLPDPELNSAIVQFLNSLLV